MLISLWILAVLVALALFFAFNVTGIFYRERDEYERPDESRLFDERARSRERFEGNKRLVLFIHGYAESPAVYAEFVDRAAELGWDAAAPLLPGHGTTPRDIVKTNFSQYFRFIREYYEPLRKKYDELVVVGTSMGGLLALKLAEEFSGIEGMVPDALVAIAPPLFLNRLWRNRVVKHPLAYFARTLGIFAPTFQASLPDPDREGCDGDHRWVGYLGIYPRQIYSTEICARKIDKELAKIDIPLYLFASREDTQAPVEASYWISRHVSSKRVKLFIANMSKQKHARHSLLMYDSVREEVWAEIVGFIEGARQCFR